MRGVRAEEPGGPDILQVEELSPLVADAPGRIVGAGAYGARAGRRRGSSHCFSLRKTPFISTINGICPRVLREALG